MEYRDQKSQKKKYTPKPYRELGKNRGGLSSKKIVGESATESGTKSLAFGTLHQDGDDEQQAGDHQQGYKDRH